MNESEVMIIDPRAPSAEQARYLKVLLQENDKRINSWPAGVKYAVLIDEVIEFVQLTHSVFSRPSKSPLHQGKLSYEVKADFLGEGGFAYVFSTQTFYFSMDDGRYQHGKHQRVSKTMKLRDDQSDLPDVLAQVTREHQLAKTDDRLKTKPPVIRHSSLADDGKLGIEFVLRRLQGKPLIDVILLDLEEPDKRLSREKRIAAARGMLQAANEQLVSMGIVHKDLTPMNMMMADDGRITIFDFNLSKRVGEEGFNAGGNRWYAPPEVFEGANITPACDVYYLSQDLALLFRCDPEHFSNFYARNRVKLENQLAQWTLPFLDDSCFRDLVVHRVAQKFKDRHHRFQSDWKLLVDTLEELQLPMERTYISIQEIIERLPLKQVEIANLIRMIKCLWQEEKRLHISSHLKHALAENKLARMISLRDFFAEREVNAENWRALLVDGFLHLASLRLKSIDYLVQLTREARTEFSAAEVLCPIVAASSLIDEEVDALNHCLYLRRLGYSDLGTGLNDFTRRELRGIQNILIHMSHFEPERRMTLAHALEAFDQVFPPQAHAEKAVERPSPRRRSSSGLRTSQVQKGKQHPDGLKLDLSSITTRPDSRSASPRQEREDGTSPRGRSPRTHFVLLFFREGGLQDLIRGKASSLAERLHPK